MNSKLDFLNVFMFNNLKCCSITEIKLSSIYIYFHSVPLLLSLLVGHLEQRGVGRNAFEVWNIFWVWFTTEVSSLLDVTPTAINRWTNIKVDKQTSIFFYDTDSSPQVLFPVLIAHIHVPKEAECSFLVQVTIQPVKHFTWQNTVRGFSMWNVPSGALVLS